MSKTFSDIDRSTCRVREGYDLIFQILRDTSLEFYRLGFLHVADYS